MTVAFWLLACLAAQAGMAAWAGEDPSRPVTDSLPEDHWLREVDFSAYRQEAQRREIEIPSDQLDQRLLDNFSYIFAKHVQTRFLLGRPGPKWVMEHMVAVLEMNRRLEEKIQDGGDVLRGGDVRKMRRYVDEVEQLAEELQDRFTDRFVEGPTQNLSVRLRLADAEEAHGQFLDFLYHARKLSEMLTERMNHFFYRPDPGIVHASDFSRLSVSMVCKTLREVSKAADERLKQFE